MSAANAQTSAGATIAAAQIGAAGGGKLTAAQKRTLKKDQAEYVAGIQSAVGMARSLDLSGLNLNTAADMGKFDAILLKQNSKLSASQRRAAWDLVTSGRNGRAKVSQATLDAFRAKGFAVPAAWDKSSKKPSKKSSKK